MIETTYNELIAKAKAKILTDYKSIAEFSRSEEADKIPYISRKGNRAKANYIVSYLSMPTDAKVDKKYKNIKFITALFLHWGINISVQHVVKRQTILLIDKPKENGRKTKKN